LGGCHDRAPSYEVVLELWLSWLDYCNGGNVESKEFKRRQDEINRLYKRMNYREQGEFHRLVHEGHPRPEWIQKLGR
jgi:hypothetical protein